ncbi:MAG TPA: arginine--tRNA ligase [Lentisphaeria bacterium]|nr:arginine--tRNA ligase [Lentisphaeria bacterium]
MQSPKSLLSRRIESALRTLLPADAELPFPLIVPTQNPDFGDFQCNAAMGLARVLRKAPRQIAQDIVAALDVAGLCAEPEIAGPGFINLRINPDVTVSCLQEMSQDQRLGLPTVAEPQSIVVDFSGPNLAKEMHVGHLRSTIIGDSICRFLEFEGHAVSRMNHVGDWGTQFGMLLHYLRTTQPEAIEQPDSFAIDDLETFYREAKLAFDASDEFKTAARKVVVELQAGDPDILAIWRVFCEESLRHCHAIYKRLDIKIEDRGESAYNDALKGIVDSLQEAEIAEISQGAVCVFIEGYETPMLVQKSDGGYIYATTDLAAIRHRIQVQEADQVIYVTDARQHEHFDKAFQTAERMGWAPADALRHVGFGMMLGADGKPFKTRTGGTVKLKDLLQEAEEQAFTVTRELGSDHLTEEDLPAVSRTIGIASVKYADLLHAVGTDYRFSWEKMLSKDGNTAVYLLMTYARTRSLGTKGGIDVQNLVGTVPFLLETPQEQKLAKKLLATLDVWPQVVGELAPNVLLQHLYELSQDFSGVWNACPVWKDGVDPAVRDSRLAIAGLLGNVIAWGLNMIGVEPLERM